MEVGAPLRSPAAETTTPKHEASSGETWSRTERNTNFTNEKLYLRIPTSVDDAVIFTMQNGKYNAVLLAKIVLTELTINVLSL